MHNNTTHIYIYTSTQMMIQLDALIESADDSQHHTYIHIYINSDDDTIGCTDSECRCITTPHIYTYTHHNSDDDDTIGCTDRECRCITTPHIYTYTHHNSDDDDTIGCTDSECRCITTPHIYTYTHHNSDDD